MATIWQEASNLADKKAAVRKASLSIQALLLLFVDFFPTSGYVFGSPFDVA